MTGVGSRYQRGQRRRFRIENSDSARQAHLLRVPGQRTCGSNNGKRENVPAPHQLAPCVQGKLVDRQLRVTLQLWNSRARWARRSSRALAMPSRSAHASFVIRAVRFTTTYCLRYVAPTDFCEAPIYDPPTAPHLATAAGRTSVRNEGPWY